MPKVLLFTSQDIGHDVFTFLHGRKDVDLTVVTQRTKRDEIYGYRGIFDLCRDHGIRVLTPRAFDEAFLTEVEQLAPDLVVCAYYPRKFPLRLIRLPRLGCINVHPGLLPEYRGTFPTPWCILNNEAEIGVTLHCMDAEIDTGDILAQRRYPIDSDETGHELYRRAMKLCANLLIESFDRILRHELKARPQPPGGSYYNKIEPQYRIDWHQPRRAIRNQVRVHAKPYFPAYCFIYNKCLLINKVSFCDPPGIQAQGAGRICEVRDDLKFVVSAVDGCLLVEDYELFPDGSIEEVKRHVRAGYRF
jgi:methionyl-tRNA formyltransferase